MIRGRLALLRTSSARLTADGAGIWAGAASITLTSDLAPAFAFITCENSLAGRSRETPPARPARHARAHRARHADADIRGMQHAEGRLAERLGDRELVHLFVVAL